MDDKKISKCLKSYLSAKKYYDSDINKSLQYFKQCLNLASTIKNNDINLNNEIDEILTETEIECNKYISSTIIKNFDNIIIFNYTNDNLFNYIEIGDVSKINKYNFGNTDLKIYNDLGLTPLHYAIKCGDTTFLKKLLKLGGKIDQSNNLGHTLLEYACLEKDPNIINFLISYGSDIKKHLLFRQNKQYFNVGDQIDIILLESYVMNTNILYNNIKYLNNIFDNLILSVSSIELFNNNIKEKITFNMFLIKLDNLLDQMIEINRNTFIEIIKEEFNYEYIFKLGCPINLIKILLYNLVPFINYNYNLRLDWLILLEIKFIIIKFYNLNPLINIKNLKENVFKYCVKKYIHNNILPIGMIQFLILQCFSILNI